MQDNTKTEKFEYLQKGIEICISEDHKFGTDAFLLADFTAPRMKDKVCDLGTGCGIIPLLLKIKFSPKEVFGVDIQDNAILQFEKTIEKNKLEGIFPIKADLKKLWDGCDYGSFDVVCCNPPYFRKDAGFKSENESQKIARHEILCDINDVCNAAKKMLKFGGRLCICNRPERLADVISAMKNNNIEPKSLRFISKNEKSSPWLFLIEGKLGGKPFLSIQPNLYVKDGENFSDEMLNIYGNK